MQGDNSISIEVNNGGGVWKVSICELAVAFGFTRALREEHTSGVSETELSLG